MRDPLDSSMVYVAPPTPPSKTWKGLWPLLLMSMPVLGGGMVLISSFLLPPHEPPYRALEDRLSFWNESTRAVLSQLYIAHALRSDLAPSELTSCSRAIASGDDLSPCAPAGREGIEASALLMGGLANFVIQHAPPRAFPEGTNRAPAEEQSGGFYLGDSPGEQDQLEFAPASPSERIFNPDAI